MYQARFAVLLGLVAFVAPGATTVKAQDPGLAYGYLFGYGATNTPTIRSFVPAPPYFALHPPVYYGQRYTRPYGDSPFASWPQLQPAPGYQPRPAASHAQILLNPYVPCAEPGCAASSTQSKDSVAGIMPVQALVIENPYYHSTQTGRLVTAEDSQTSDRASVND